METLSFTEKRQTSDLSTEQLDSPVSSRDTLVLSTSRPANLLKAYSQKYPNMWKNVDNFRKMKGDWPEWCFLPMAASYAIASNGQDGISLSSLSDVAPLSALIAWKYTQGIYRFEPTVYKDLVKTSVDKDLPVDVLYRLPEWGVYAELQGDDECHGFFAHLEFDMHTKRTELRLLLDYEDRLHPIILHLGQWSVVEAVSKAFKVSEQNFPLMHEAINYQAEKAQKCLSLLLYICSEKPDIESIEGNLPTYARPKKSKNREKFHAPKKPKVWMIGKKLASIASANVEWKGGEHASPKAHIRRAHWHGYWTGKRDSTNRKFIYKWIPTMLVNSK